MHLLDVCSMIARRLLDRVIGVQKHSVNSGYIRQGFLCLNLFSDVNRNYNS